MSKAKQNGDVAWEDLKRLRDAVKARGTDFLISLTPPRALIQARQLTDEQRKNFDYASLLEDYKKYLQELRNAGFLIVPNDKFASIEGDDYFFERDVHWTSNGARLTAHLLAETIKPLEYNFPKKNFTSRATGVGSTKGTLGFAAGLICGARYPTQRSDAFETVLVSSNGGSDDEKSAELFGDEALPEVALVGTSFSATKSYNFLGFLREALQADVLTAAFAGAGFDGSLSQYLLSDSFQKSPPKLLIWEVPYQYFGRADSATMRRIVPLVDNGCANKNVLHRQEKEIDGNSDEYVEVLFNGGGSFSEEVSKNLILDMQFSNPNVKEVVLEIWYLDGNHEFVRIRYNRFTNTDGRFITELSSSSVFAKQPVVDVRVQVVDKIEGSIRVNSKLCSSREPIKQTIAEGLSR